MQSGFDGEWRHGKNRAGNVRRERWKWAATGFVKSLGGEGARHAGTREGAAQEEEQAQRPRSHILPAVLENSKGPVWCGQRRGFGQ